MRQLPIGMYRPGDSILHRMDASAKLLCLALLLAAVVATTTAQGYLMWALLAASLLRLAGLGAGAALAPVLRLKWFLAVMLLMNFFFSGQGQPLVAIGIFRPSLEGLLLGVRMAARFLLLLEMSNAVMASTAPMAVTSALERLLSPLRYIGVPTGLVAMILSVAIQFVPTIFEEADTIRKAQTARGAGFDSPRLLERARAALSLLIPVFLASFQRADELSLAMEARGYRAEGVGIRRRGRKRAAEEAGGRPAGRRPPFRWLDWAALLSCTVLTIVCILL